MGTVIGPISREDWYLMSTLRGNMKVYKEDPERFDLAIKKTTETVKETLQSYIGKVA